MHLSPKISRVTVIRTAGGLRTTVTQSNVLYGGLNWSTSHQDIGLEVLFLGARGPNESGECARAKCFALANADLCNCFKVRDDNTWGCMTQRGFCTISNVSDYQCQVFSVRVCVRINTLHKIYNVRRRQPNE